MRLYISNILPQSTSSSTRSRNNTAKMAAVSYNPCHVLLVGSIPLPSTEDVFRELTTTFPNRLLRIPDGETGIRGQYVMWQLDLLKDYQIQPGAESVHEAPPTTHLKFFHTGFQDYAVDSYREFCRLGDKGVIPKGVRFQVCLPTPLNVIVQYMQNIKSRSSQCTRRLYCLIFSISKTTSQLRI